MSPEIKVPVKAIESVPAAALAAAGALARIEGSAAIVKSSNEPPWDEVSRSLNSGASRHVPTKRSAMNFESA